MYVYFKSIFKSIFIIASFKILILEKNNKIKSDLNMQKRRSNCYKKFLLKRIKNFNFIGRRKLNSRCWWILLVTISNLCFEMSTLLYAYQTYLCSPTKCVCVCVGRYVCVQVCVRVCVCHSRGGTR